MIITSTTQDLQCVTNDTSQTFAVGDVATICLHFVNGNQSIRMAYNLTVDTYSTITVAGGNYYFLPTNSNLTIQVQAWHNNSTSTPASFLLYGNTSTIYIPIFSAVVQIANGQISNVAWDNGCYGCSPENCYVDVNFTQNCQDNTCTNISNSSPAGGSCDPKIYVSWIGTDKNGMKMTSAGLRMSRFRQFSIGQLYGQALSQYDSSVAASKTQYNCQYENTCQGNSTTNSIATAPSSSSANNQANTDSSSNQTIN